LQFELADEALLPGFGEYARGLWRNGAVSIKVTSANMARAERACGTVNGLDLQARKTMFAERSDVYEDAGWAWTSDYRLVKVAPGLLS
jgi:hypothetical protein